MDYLQKDIMKINKLYRCAAGLNVDEASTTEDGPMEPAPTGKHGFNAIRYLVMMSVRPW